MKRRIALWVTLLVGTLGVGLALTTRDARANRGDGALGVVYVTSQGLYYDTFVTVEDQDRVQPGKERHRSSPRLAVHGKDYAKAQKAAIALAEEWEGIVADYKRRKAQFDFWVRSDPIRPARRLLP